MVRSKTVESTAFDGARTQSARKHSIFRSMLTTHRQGSSTVAGTATRQANPDDKAVTHDATTARRDD